MHIGKVITLQSQQQTQHWKELGSYFWQERKMLGIVTVSGLIYNVGMLAGPWFDGQLAQCLYDIVQGEQSASDMYRLCLCYLATILCVQGARYIKRLYVRKFANHVSLTMRARRGITRWPIISRRTVPWSSRAHPLTGTSSAGSWISAAATAICSTARM